MAGEISMLPAPDVTNPVERMNIVSSHLTFQLMYTTTSTSHVFNAALGIFILTIDQMTYNVKMVTQ